MYENSIGRRAGGVIKAQRVDQKKNLVVVVIMISMSLSVYNDNNDRAVKKFE